jgi:hypothetical protein
MKYTVIITDKAIPIADFDAPIIAEKFAKNAGTIQICNEAVFMCIRLEISKKTIPYNEIEFKYKNKSYYPTNIAKFEDISIFEAFPVIEFCLEELVNWK